MADILSQVAGLASVFARFKQGQHTAEDERAKARQQAEQLAYERATMAQKQAEDARRWGLEYNLDKDAAAEDRRANQMREVQTAQGLQVESATAGAKLQAEQQEKWTTAYRSYSLALSGVMKRWQQNPPKTQAEWQARQQLMPYMQGAKQMNEEQLRAATAQLLPEAGDAYSTDARGEVAFSPYKGAQTAGVEARTDLTEAKILTEGQTTILREAQAVVAQGTASAEIQKATAEAQAAISEATILSVRAKNEPTNQQLAQDLQKARARAENAMAALAGTRQDWVAYIAKTGRMSAEASQTSAASMAKYRTELTKRGPTGKTLWEDLSSLTPTYIPRGPYEYKPPRVDMGKLQGMAAATLRSHGIDPNSETGKGILDEYMNLYSGMGQGGPASAGTMGGFGTEQATPPFGELPPGFSLPGM